MVGAEAEPSGMSNAGGLERTTAHTPLRRGPQAWWALEDAWPVRHGVGLRPHGGAQHHCLER
jgi:hypothetical protein